MARYGRVFEKFINFDLYLARTYIITCCLMFIYTPLTATVIVVSEKPDDYNYCNDNPPALTGK